MKLRLRSLFLLIPALSLCVSVLSSFIIPGQAAAIPSDSQLVNQGLSKTDCKTAGFGDNDPKICANYYKDGYKNPTKSIDAACKDAGVFRSLCDTGYKLGQADRKTADKTAQASSKGDLSNAEITELAKSSTTCSPNSNDEFANMSDAQLDGCIKGYIAGYKGASKGATCTSKKVVSVNICEKAYDNGKSDKAAGVKDKASQTTQAGEQVAAGDKQTDQDPSCDASGFSLSWILCPIFNSVTDAAQGIFNYIVQPFLVTTPISTNSNDPSYQIWSNLRIYGNIFLIIGLLVIVFGQTIGGGVVDAYTAKKVLPRLLAAAILINLSIYIVAFMIDITNVIGGGISNIMTAPLTHNCQSASDIGRNCWDFKVSGDDILGIFTVGIMGFMLGSTAILGVLLAILFNPAGAVLGGLTAAFFIALPMILAIIAIFATLVIRQGVILFLIITSPIAFALYCLPNTEKYFKKWWTLLMEMMLMYPIIIAIFGVASILSVTILQANGITPLHLRESAGANNNFFTNHVDRTLALVVAFSLQFIPLLMIPFAFRFASGALGKIYSAATTAGQQVNKLAEGRREHAKRDFKAQTLAARARTYHGAREWGQRNQGPLGIGRFAARSLAARAGGYNIEGMMSAGRAEKAKELNDQIATGRDEEIRGLTVNKAWADAQGAVQNDGDNNGQVRIENGVRQYRSLGGNWVNEADVDAGHSRWGNDQFAQQTALSYEMKKAIKEDDIQNLKQNFHNVANGWGMTGGEATGAWIGAAFENQNQNLSYKYTSAGTGALDNDVDFVNELYERKGSYSVAQMSSDTVEQLKNAYTLAEARQDTDQMNKVSAIAETFMQEIGTGGGGNILHQADDGQPPVVAGGGGGGRRQASTPGAAHVAERVVELAQLARPVPRGTVLPGPTVYEHAPSGSHDDGHTPTPNQKSQH